jgi:ATP-dependent DNA ligase
MIRLLMVLMGVVSAVIVMAEMVAATVLWSRGSLTKDSLKEIRIALSPPAAKAAAEAETAAEAAATPQPSAQDVRDKRVSRVLDLDARENELQLLKRLTTDLANQLISERQAFDQLREAFRKELKEQIDKANNDATEQSRSILLASPPEEAVQRLMGLTLEENVDLMRGLPEKQIARILQAFQRDVKAAARGQEIFEALYHGSPTVPLLNGTGSKIEEAAAPTGRRGG